MMRSIIVLTVFFLAVCTGSTSAQVTVVPNQAAAQLLAYITGPNVTVSNAVLTCPGNANGLFTVATSNLGLDSGIVLTTGGASNTGGIGVNGPSSIFASTNNFANGNALLDAASGGNTYDACKLEFDFSSSLDTVVLRYVFGSEEYKDFSCALTNDIFGYYITGPGYATPTNIALIPGTSIPVAINSITDTTINAPIDVAVCKAMGAGSPFAQYFVDNATGVTITYQGFTTMLEAKAAITRDTTYHMTIVIADVTDGIMDSGVFIEGSSLSARAAVNAVSGVRKEDIIISPNPFKGYLKVDLPSVLMNEHVTVEIFNELGQRVHRFDGKGSELNAALQAQTANMHAGLFFINLAVPSKGITQINKIHKTL